MNSNGEYSLTGTYSGVNRSYEDVDVTMTPEEQKLYTLMFVLDAAGVIGIPLLSDADVQMANQRLKWIADKELAEKYGVQDKLMEKNVRPK